MQVREAASQTIARVHQKPAPQRAPDWPWDVCNAFNLEASAVVAMKPGPGLRTPTAMTPMTPGIPDLRARFGSVSLQAWRTHFLCPARPPLP